MMDKDITVFNQLVDGKIEAVTSRGNVILIKLDNKTGLILGPEYGGEILYRNDKKNFPSFIYELILAMAQC